MFLKRQIRNLEQAPYGEVIKVGGLKWTASKAALNELVFALQHTRCFKLGSTTLSETVKFFEEHFSINLGIYHNTMGEIRIRKTDRTKFLHLLNENLQIIWPGATSYRSSVLLGCSAHTQLYNIPKHRNTGNSGLNGRFVRV